MGSINRRISFQADLGINSTKKITKAKRVDGMAQVANTRP
jgi:hypothetical protein